MRTLTKDGITITTKYPIYFDDARQSPEDYYLNNDGKGKDFLEKVANAEKKLQDTGIIDASRSILDSVRGGQSHTTDSTVTPPVVVSVAPEKKKMTTTTKVLIGVGVAVVLYFGYKHFSKHKK